VSSRSTAARSRSTQSTVRAPEPRDIILSWADREVDHRSLPWIVAQAPAGRPINIVVWRNRAQTQLPVVPEKMPE
jgi:S1-C subfamily serine protease